MRPTRRLPPPPRSSRRLWIGLSAAVAGAGLGMVTLMIATQSTRPMTLRAGLELGGLTLVLERLQTGELHVRAR